MPDGPRPQPPAGILRANAARNAVALAAIGCGGMALWALPHLHPSSAAAQTALHLLRDVMYGPLKYRIFEMALTPSFVAVLALALVLERLMPARPGQGWPGVTLAQDVVWFFYEGVLHALIATFYIAALAKLLAPLSHRVAALDPHVLPAAVRIGAGILLVDFCYWLQHRCHHKFAWLWQLHTVHHSQRNLNFFTDFRYHILEYVVRETFLAVPFLVLGVALPHIVYFSVFFKWYTRFYHANIKTNLGPLRYILVTPQSHRVHHSFDPRHIDKNFGSLFSVWDLAFGTQYTGWHDYPATGIDDPAFPLETRADLASLLLTPLAQMLYPLRRLKP